MSRFPLVLSSVLLTQAKEIAAISSKFILDPQHGSAWTGFCDPQYAAICGIQNAIITVKVALGSTTGGTSAVCDALQSNTSTPVGLKARADMIATIQNGTHNSRGDRFPLMLVSMKTDSEVPGMILADSGLPKMIGNSVDSNNATGSVVKQDDLMVRMKAAAASGGRFISRFGTRVSALMLALQVFGGVRSMSFRSGEGL